MAAKRVDEALVLYEMADSIEHARLLVLEGKVYQGSGKVSKASDRYKPLLKLTVRDNARKYVSRGGLKLEKALDVFGIDPVDQVCVDVGASTGGFTDVLIKRGATRVYAVDVGFGLLSWSLRSDARVTVMEKTNARNLTAQMFDPRPSLGATDVSFISLKTVLPAALHVLEGDNRRFVALIKPQFEAPRQRVGAGGIVRDRAVHGEVVRGIVDFVRTIGWRAQALDFSPITGADGNIEFLVDLVPEAHGAMGVQTLDIEGTVERAWNVHVEKTVKTPG